MPAHIDLAGVVAGIVAVTTIGGALFAVYRVARRVESAIGVDENGRSIAERMDRVEHQLWPNGGGSLMDKVSDTSTAVIELQAEQRIVKELLSDALTTRGNRSSGGGRSGKRATP